MKILYFTSTGNNLYISKKLCGELFSIPQLMKNNDFNVEDDVVGIVFPVYFATSPKMIRKFLEKVNIVCNYLFLICSYGSDGDQNAFRIMIKTLKKKGLNVNYANSVLMVDNFLPVFDMAKEKAIKNDSDIDKQIEFIKNDIESNIINIQENTYWNSKGNENPLILSSLGALLYENHREIILKKNIFTLHIHLIILNRSL